MNFTNDTIKRIQYEIEQSKIHDDKRVKLSINDVEVLISGFNDAKMAVMENAWEAIKQGNEAGKYARSSEMRLTVIKRLIKRNKMLQGVILDERILRQEAYAWYCKRLKSRFFRLLICFYIWLKTLKNELRCFKNSECCGLCLSKDYPFQAWE